MIFDADIRNAVEHGRDAVDAVAIHAILQTGEGRRDDARSPRDGPAVGIETGRKARQRSGPVDVVLHVVFARPGEFHRNSDGFGDLDRFIHMLAGASETSAQIVGVDVDFFDGQARDHHGRIARGARDLRSDPDLAFVGLHGDHAAMRLHRGVRKIRRFVERFDLLRGGWRASLGIAGVQGHRAGFFEKIGEHFVDGRRLKYWP